MDTSWIKMFSWKPQRAIQENVDQYFHFLMATESSRFWQTLSTVDPLKSGELASTLKGTPSLRWTPFWHSPAVYQLIIQWVRHRQFDQEAAVLMLCEGLLTLIDRRKEEKGRLDYSSGLVVDMNSHFALTDYIVGDKASAYKGQEKKTVLNKLKKASQTILDINPVIWEFITANCSLLVLRETHDQTAKSFSHAECLGAVTFENYHLTEVTSSQMQADLLHEAIHNFLNKVELKGVLLNDHNVLKDELFSPWTGELTSLHSLIHHCFVWGGVHRYLSEVTRSVHSTEITHKLLEFIEKGFLDKKLLLAVNSYRDSLPPYIFNHIVGLTHSFQNKQLVCH
ncbi:hypothetical protein CS022_09530 [Veronia nyctiphanis]|uniref:Uncharacterized protein n=1 Tax=Veronia nyctiphanis TaxID=1278244 RepID=A0A4Q0YS37_9GAMM|nr:hypothetical protein [Veronia nyctiphanis]RXJ73475.1 hypothetical protein CS022_09530 [Veronia nyctiphanis]